MYPRNGTARILSRRPLERELAAARTRVQRLQAQLGAAVSPHQPSRQRTMRGFKIAHAELRAELAEAEADVARILSGLGGSATPRSRELVSRRSRQRRN